MMIYYKLVRDGEVFAVSTSRNLLRHQDNPIALIPAKPENAEFLQIDGDVLCHDRWMKQCENDFFTAVEVTITPISEEEYRLLAEATLPQKDDGPASPPVIEPEVETPDFDKNSIDYLRNKKLSEVSLACSRAITEGFDMQLFDGKLHHFSMTAEDQANLNEARLKIINGDDYVLYHADGEEIRLFPKAQMENIIAAAEAHKQYHLIYHNSLKAWIKALRRASTISKVHYGSEIPERYQTESYKQILEALSK